MSVLGNKTEYPTAVDPRILEFIPRDQSRRGLHSIAPSGFDYWTCYEFSWLNARGSPEEAVLKLRYSSDSKCIVESKSLKLYLGGFASTRAGDKGAARDRNMQDLARGLGTANLTAELLPLEHDSLTPGNIKGYCIDIHDLKDPVFDLSPAILRRGSEVRDELMYTHSFRSLCPVTGQPDWATVLVLYNGPEILPDSLRAYLCSFRNHRGFHEACCERIYSDLMEHCMPSRLSIACLFTRRGGIDITPVRSTSPDSAVKLRRTLRQ